MFKEQLDKNDNENAVSDLVSNTDQVMAGTPF
jgi:hypothetical protein